MAITKYKFRHPSYSPGRDLEEVQNRLAGFFDNPSAGRRSWTPSVNVSETKEGLEVTAELPGLSEENLSIELENNVLTISGEKTEQVTEGAGNGRTTGTRRRRPTTTAAGSATRTNAATGGCGCCASAARRWSGGLRTCL